MQNTKVEPEAILAAIKELTAERGPKWGLTVLGDKLGVTPQSIISYRKRWASVDRAILEVRERRHDWVESALFKQIENGNITAIIFYAKTQMKDRGYVERQEITGPDGDSLAITIIEAVAPHDTDPGPA